MIKSAPLKSLYTFIAVAETGSEDVEVAVEKPPPADDKTPSDPT